MTKHADIRASLWGDNALPLRPPSQVMNLERLGSLHQSRLSFMRTLVRRIFRERWKIELATFELNNDGFGTVVYEVNASDGLFSFVLFSDLLLPEERNDRVIATKWDLTMALVEGRVNPEYIAKLKENVPKQEAGRVDSRVFVLSRANRSARNFDYVVNQLATGQQPDVSKIAEVGYLYRTTAVYGSGKLGMADWEKVQQKHRDFARPFASEMFVCFMLRNFSLLQVEHIARHRNEQTFTPMRADIKRYFGIGNSTGLGMAPYLVNHPVLINQWIEMRELALARIRSLGAITSQIKTTLLELLKRCAQHTHETITEDKQQTQHNIILAQEMNKLTEQVVTNFTSWNELIAFSEQHCSLQSQEILVSVMLELYPELVDDLEDFHCADENLDLDPLMPLHQLKAVIERRYDWALAIDFDAEGARETYWYRSEEKMEPRLGSIADVEGKKKAMALAVGYAVRKCYNILVDYMTANPSQITARFMVAHPKLRGIVRRIQGMDRCVYGDIQANLLDKNVLPMHLLRCKLAFFGVSKFDPRSRLWVRNTMFQGAPLLEDIGKPFSDDWFMPLIPKQ
ncbi:MULTISPECIES: hypothetical protein [unclassified Pseudoalteromonas]|uniref:hypothetical protein n=1 Tax=unclassified Pseudoalteromonas TaxID=194690 RepID=UPI000C08AE05|nr:MULTISPECIES: hypothetical protein [unclassified Pseudoalteromonas]MDP2635572.1 hypothetical protein [Pseudoalteromonas sp. 1_MG-2023]PHN89048.1 hypothetical protein CSC79_14445 [Pseudoalteromonas sp. 3D05]